MSHVTTIDPHTHYEIPALKRMCLNEGWTFLEGQTHFAWYGRHVGDYPIPEGFTKEDMGKCDHAIHIPGCSYELGVVGKNGKNYLLWDFYGAGGLDVALGQDAGKLKQAYGIAKSQLACKKHKTTWKMKNEVKGRPGWKKLVAYGR